MTPPRILSSLSDIAGDYDAVLCDVWGVAHNGLRAHEAAMTALQDFRAGGGIVAMLTNAPRPAQSVAAQMTRLGTPGGVYDAIVTSGDAAKAVVASGSYGLSCLHVGAPKDMPFFDGLDHVRRVSMEEAQYILCTGLRDDQTETPADYAEMIAAGVARGLPLLCANPDIVVDVGDQRLYCAGAIAQAYNEAGGSVVYFGKPNPPIYDRAFEVLQEISGRPVDPARVLAIGDGIRTDVKGARAAGLDCLFICAGLAAADVLDASGTVNPEKLAAFLADHGEAPRYALSWLR